MNSPSDVLGRVLERLERVTKSGAGHRALCPAHEDREPSLSVGQGDDGRVLLRCHRGCDVKAIVANVGLGLRDLHVADVPVRAGHARAVPPPPSHRRTQPPVETADHQPWAETLWRRSVMRAQASPPVEADHRARLFLQRRGLEPAVRMGLAGLLDDSRALPEEVSWWPGVGFRVIAPLLDVHGRLVTIQARRIVDGEPRVVFPKRSRPKGTVFANHPGRGLLCGDTSQPGVVVFGEGLTDSLALSICLDGPVLCAPGVDFCAPAIGPWVRGRAVALALDNDDAAECVVAAVTARALQLGAASVWRVQWPSGLKDACDVLAAEGPEEVARCVLNAPGGSDDR